MANSGESTERAEVSYLLDPSDRIAKVSASWGDFARANGANDLAEGAVGRTLWEFITDSNVRHLYRQILTRARRDRPISLPFRCDAPDRKRSMRIRIEHRGDGFLEIRTTVERLEHRPAISLLDARIAAEGQPLLSLCSWCKRAEVEGAWLELEEAVERLGLFAEPEMPGITHGICNRCLEEVTNAAALSA